MLTVQASRSSLDVHEQLVPASDVHVQFAVDVGWLHVPQRLVLQPHLGMGGAGSGADT